jgi:hypothetical protein
LATTVVGGVACRSVVAPSPTTPTPASTVDVLAYVIGAPSVWPRVGNHSQNQVVDEARREVCWVKYANPRTFECWRWDDRFIYHVVDHGIDGNTGESYSFADGRWMPRYLTDEWRLDVSTTIVWFDPTCGVERARSGPFRYHQRVWREPARDAGGDLGVRDTIVLEYAPEDPAGGPTAPERFYFAYHAGWYEWQRGDARSIFNRIGGPPRPVARDIACDPFAALSLIVNGRTRPGF